MKFRMYASGDIIDEELFDEYDNASPYYDDYEEIEIPDQLYFYIVEG